MNIYVRRSSKTQYSGRNKQLKFSSRSTKLAFQTHLINKLTINVGESKLCLPVI